VSEDKPRGRILVVDDEQNMCQFLKTMLSREGYQVLIATNGPQALKTYEEDHFDLVIEDLKMPGMDGIQLLSAIKELDETQLVVIITAFSTWESAVEAMRLGAFDYIRKPFDNEAIKVLVARAVEVAQLQREGVETEEETFAVGNLIGSSPQIQEIQRAIRRVAPTDTTVLIQGESGTGKELVARAIHFSSYRLRMPFIAVSCSAFTESLLESELFGHIKGSFTGAITDKKGLFEVADKGTIFLDEVAEMSKKTQAKFLRAVEEREFRPVGSANSVKVDLRVVTATNKDLEAEVEAGNFREDLFYRLNVVPIYLPPLRERRGDIPLLAGHLLAKYAGISGKEIISISPLAMEVLVSYDWPGNVRELDNCIQRALAFAEGDEIEAADIAGGKRAGILEAVRAKWLREGKPDHLASLVEEGMEGARFFPEVIPSEGINLEERLAGIERNYITYALRQTNWNITAAAKHLGTSFRSLRYRIKKLGIKQNDATS